jgi:carbon-monoxide dehydrogenase small subunit
MRILVTLDVNGHQREVGIRPYATLLDVVREDLDLTGTKRGCDMGTCGCCTVLMDGNPALACLTLAADCEGKAIETIESLRSEDGLHPLQLAFEEAGATQCGFCTPGFIMAAKAFLRDKPDLSREDIAYEISGNMCRCTGYVKILDAIEKAAAMLREDEYPEKIPDVQVKTGKKAAGAKAVKKKARSSASS